MMSERRIHLKMTKKVIDQYCTYIVFLSIRFTLKAHRSKPYLQKNEQGLVVPRHLLSDDRIKQHILEKANLLPSGHAKRMQLLSLRCHHYLMRIQRHLLQGAKTPR